MRDHDSVVDQVHQREVRLFHGKERPSGKERMVLIGIKIEIRDKGNMGAPTYQPCLYSFCRISTSRLMRKAFRFHRQISASEIGVAATSTSSIRGPHNRNQRDSGGRSGIWTKVLVKYSIFPILCISNISFID